MNKMRGPFAFAVGGAVHFINNNRFKQLFSKSIFQMNPICPLEMFGGASPWRRILEIGKASDGSPR